MSVRSGRQTDEAATPAEEDPPACSVVVLGSGTSHGVPMIGCTCAVCTSSDPHDRRTRPSVYVRVGDTSLLIDTAPELRLQCIAHGIDRVDAVLFTHHHADHVAGLDDLRRFNWLMGRPIPLYGTARTLENIKRMFLYAFEPATDSPHSCPEIELHPIDEQPFSIDGVRIVPVPLLHGRMPVLGFRIGPFAYCTDCSEIPTSSLDRLEGVQVLILDALRKTPHPAHFNLEQAVETARRIGAERTYFTHMTHQLPHAATNRELPEGMALAHDGLRIEALRDAET
ncbi:MAG: MBL fold metallo-hydrolase [Planctomycetota bacterium]|nr:MAG: MBL fold metallo-hydrolase [Planctomycetota bacterium]